MTRDQTSETAPRKLPKRRVGFKDWRKRAFDGLIVLIFVVNAILLFSLVQRLMSPRASKGSAGESERRESTRPPQIEVLNGCGVPGLAAKFTKHLREAGFDVVKTDNYESFRVEKTIVIDRRGEISLALRIADALGLDRSRVLQEIHPAYLIDATVILGRDFRTLGSWKSVENRGG